MVISKMKNISSKNIVLVSILFVVVLLGALFIVERMSLRKIDSQSTLGEQTIDLSNRPELKEKNQGSSKQIDTILKKE